MPPFKLDGPCWSCINTSTLVFFVWCYRFLLSGSLHAVSMTVVPSVSVFPFLLHSEFNFIQTRSLWLQHWHIGLYVAYCKFTVSILFWAYYTASLTSYSFLFLSFSVHASLGFCVLVRYCQEFCGHNVFPLLHEALSFEYESLSKLCSL